MCGCQRTTYLCLCRHKERRIERCHIYQLREAGSCWAYCFPKCQAKVRRYCLQRVCRDCEAYFREKYGEEQYKKLIQLFLEYKESKGWGKQAIDPRTIPREVLLKRQSAPPKLPSHNDGQTRARGQPYQPHQPMAMAPANRHQNDRGLAPVAEHSYGQPKIRRHGTPFCREPPSSSNSEAGTVTSVKSVISSIKATFVPKVSGARHTQRPEPLYIPSNTNKPYPADPSLFVVGDSDEEDDNTEHVDKGHEFFVEPKCLYDSRKLPRVHGIIPELAHLARVKRSGKPGTKTPETPKVYTRETPELQHPRPKHYKVPTEYRNPESISDCSLVKRITKAARKLVIPNLDWEEMENGKLVPYIMTPLPGEPRTPTPPSSAASVENTGETKRYTFSEMRPIDVAIANNTVPEFLVPGRGRPQAGERRDEKFAITPISYFVTTSPDPKSPTGASVRVSRSRSHESVMVPPPQRLDGILIPSASACQNHPNKGKGDSEADCKACRGSFFEERGLPSNKYIDQECRSATFEKKHHSPILVSVSAPARRYSSAVQPCSCDQFAELGKCSPCRERESISKQLKSGWI